MEGGFWLEQIWLPENVTWEDISNGPGKRVVYAEAGDYWVLGPLVVGILTLRFLSEKYIFAPLGRHLHISDGRKKKPPPNNVLEAAFKKSTHSVNLSTLASQTRLTERQVERWLRLRRSQDKPSTLVKFCEEMWKGTYFLFMNLLTLHVAWGQDWVWDVEKYYEGYPHHGVTQNIKWIFMISTSLYISLVITHYRDVRRKDFHVMFMHHLMAIALLVCIWICNLHRIGIIIIILHDLADVPLQIGKAAKYAKLKNAVLQSIFAVFVTVWVVTRLVLLPFIFRITCSTRVPKSPVLYAQLILFGLIISLNFYWSSLIYKTACMSLRAGEFPNDARSSVAEDSCSSTPTDDSPKKVIAPAAENQAYYRRARVNKPGTYSLENTPI